MPGNYVTLCHIAKNLTEENMMNLMNGQWFVKVFLSNLFPVPFLWSLKLIHQIFAHQYAIWIFVQYGISLGIRTFLIFRNEWYVPGTYSKHLQGITMKQSVSIIIFEVPYMQLTLNMYWTWYHAMMHVNTYL